MPVTPEEIWQIADELCQSSREEVERRNAASRSYYSFFHFAADYANRNAAVPPAALRGGTHENLRDYFSSGCQHTDDFKKTARKIGIWLRSCHKARCEADYHLHTEFSEADLASQRHQCCQAIAALKAV